MRTDSDRYMSAYADPNPAHKTRNRVLIISAHPGLKVSGLLRIISVPDRRFRISLSYYPILGTLVRLRLSNLPVASPFSSSTDLIARTLLYSAACHTLHAMFHRGILPRIGIVSCSIFSCIRGVSSLDGTSLPLAMNIS